MAARSPSAIAAAAAEPPLTSTSTAVDSATPTTLPSSRIVWVAPVASPAASLGHAGRARPWWRRRRPGPGPARRRRARPATASTDVVGSIPEQQGEPGGAQGHGRDEGPGQPEGPHRDAVEGTGDGVGAAEGDEDETGLEGARAEHLLEVGADQHERHAEAPGGGDGHGERGAGPAPVQGARGQHRWLAAPADEGDGRRRGHGDDERDHGGGRPRGGAAPCVRGGEAQRHERHREQDRAPRGQPGGGRAGRGGHHQGRRQREGDEAERTVDEEERPPAQAGGQARPRPAGPGRRRRRPPRPRCRWPSPGAGRGRSPSRRPARW